MHESGLSSSLSSVQHQELVEIIRSLILATDISRQQEFLTQLRYLLDKEELDLAQARCRHFMLQVRIALLGFDCVTRMTTYLTIESQKLIWGVENDQKHLGSRGSS
jgi:hypothetical protein